MKNLNPTQLIRAAHLALVVLLCWSVNIAAASEPGAGPIRVVAVTQKLDDPIGAASPTDCAADVNSDDGIPLAREDVILLRTAVTGTHGVSPADPTELKISSRSTDPKMVAFLSRTSMSQLTSIYREASLMIDARHVDPPSYEARTQGAIQDIILAVGNDQFLRAHGISPQPQAVRSVQDQLRQLIQTQPARDVNQALGLMQMAAEVAFRGIGLRREAAALEFLNGTLDALDPYSAFLPESAGSKPGTMRDAVRTASLEENMVGVGVELKAHSLGVELVGIIDNSPAFDLGLREGDVIIAVNQQSMEGRSLNEVADRLIGAAGTSVTVDILRDGTKYRGTMVRRKIYISSVTGTKLIDSQARFGYVRMKQFSASSAEDLEKALWTLHNQGMQGLVLDLRGNPGGLLDECIDVTDLFVPCGTIVSTRGRTASDNSRESATYEKTWSVPLVVLVDENSASASEIFAAAIQENQRGVIVGRNSYGKGTVQTHFPMQSVPAILKLTTAKFYSPTGREMAGAGVTPDVPVQTQTTSYRGTDSDADVQMALQVLRQGTPAQLAAASATCRVKAGTPLTINSPQRPLTQGVREQ